MGGCGRNWEVLRGFDWSDGWYTVIPLPTTKIKWIYSQNLSTPLKKSHAMNSICSCTIAKGVLRQSEIAPPSDTKLLQLSVKRASADAQCPGSGGAVVVTFGKGADEEFFF